MKQKKSFSAELFFNFCSSLQCISVWPSMNFYTQTMIKNHLKIRVVESLHRTTLGDRVINGAIMENLIV